MRQGPIFTDILLADEINRTPPKTQAALLEAMEERQVTIDGDRHSLSPIFTVLATDPLDGRFLTASHSVLVTQTHLRQLESDEVVDHFSICCIGGKDDTIVYAGTMPAGCSWTSLGGEEYDSLDNKLAFPMPTVKHGSAGFTVSPRGGYTSRDLVANVHTWWDGGGHIRLRTSWTVAEPQGVDCSIGTFTH